MCFMVDGVTLLFVLQLITLTKNNRSSRTSKYLKKMYIPITSDVRVAIEIPELGTFKLRTYLQIYAHGPFHCNRRQTVKHMLLW